MNDKIKLDIGSVTIPSSLEKPYLIIVEGPQGSGKTTITNELREIMTSTNLFRLSGCKSEDAIMPYRYHNTVFDMIEKMGIMGIDNDIVMDRSFMSEWVYTMCGYKKDREVNSFNDFGYALHDKLIEISHYYNVAVVLLMADEDTYNHRLRRDKPEYATEFNAQNSMAQQDMYRKISFMMDNRYYMDNIRFVFHSNCVYNTPREAAITLLDHIKGLYK